MRNDAFEEQEIQDAFDKVDSQRATIRRLETALVDMSKRKTEIENKYAIQSGECDKLREALRVAKDYLDYSLGSPAYEGPNPYPIIEAALQTN